MLPNKQDIQLPIVITRGFGKNSGVSIYSPDLNIETRGTDIVDAMSKAQQCFSAMYYYNLSKNIELNLTCTYEDASREAKGKKRSFASFVPLVP